MLLLRTVAVFLLIAVVQSQLQFTPYQQQLAHSTATQYSALKDFRFFHAISTAGRVDVWIDGQLAFGNQSFQAVSALSQNILGSPYDTVTELTDDVSNVVVVSAGKSPALSPLNYISVQFPTKPFTIGSWALIYHPNVDGTSALLPLVVPENCDAVKTPGSSAFQIYNLDSTFNFPTVDVTYSGGYLVQQLRQLATSDYTEIKSGNYTFTFTGPLGSFNVPVTLQSGWAYAVVLWGGPASPPSVTLTPIASCNPTAPPLSSPWETSYQGFATPLPQPPVPAPQKILLNAAQGLAAVSDKAWSSAISSYLSGASTTSLDSYFAVYHPAATSQGFFFPGNAPPLLNAASALYELKVYLNSIMGAEYLQNPSQITILNDRNFLSSFSWLYFGGFFASTGMTHKYFTLGPDNVTWSVSLLVQFNVPPPPPVSLTQANTIMTNYAAEYVATFNNYTYFNLPNTIPTFYDDTVAPYFSATQYTPFTTTTVPSLTYYNLAASQSRLLQTYFMGGTTTFVRSGEFLISDFSFVSVDVIIYSLPGQANHVVFTHNVFSLQDNLVSFSLVYSSEFSTTVETRPQPLDGITVTGNITWQYRKGVNLALQGRTLTFHLFYLNYITEKFYSEYSVYIGNETTIHRDFPNDLAYGIVSYPSFAGLKYSLSTSASVGLVLSESSLVQTYLMQITNATNTLASGLTTMEVTRRLSPFMLPTFNWTVVGFKTVFF